MLSRKSLKVETVVVSRPATPPPPVEKPKQPEEVAPVVQQGVSDEEVQRRNGAQRTSFSHH